MCEILSEACRMGQLLQREEVCVVWTGAHETLAVRLKSAEDISNILFTSFHFATSRSGY